MYIQIHSLFLVCSIAITALMQVNYNKTYERLVEEKYRMRIFFGNLRAIEEHNEKYANGTVSFKKAVNKFADLTSIEFRTIYTGYAAAQNTIGVQVSAKNILLPDSVDWREKGAVTPVKDQSICGSCWAFSATGSLEGQHFLNSGQLVSLSEQNLVDCSRSEGNNGCGGGLMDFAFDYVKTNNGIDTEESYPYDGVDLPCRFNNQTVGATITGYKKPETGNEQALQEAIATIGPVSVGVDASDFQFYSSGIYSSLSCGNSPEDLDHGVLAVGYDTDNNGQQYYIVKNSWGQSWGDRGYLHMLRNADNHCGIATDATYPLV